MAVHLAPLASERPAHSRDRSLQRARRLDWRFLLAEPHLGRVAYCGPAADGLLQALRDFGACVAVIRDGDPAAGAPFDVAVTQAPSEATLARAAALVRVGGWVYCEVGRAAPRRGTHAGARPIGMSRASAVLRAHGFDEVEAYWHHPDFQRCTRMIPVGRSAALVFVAARIVGRPLAPLVAGVGAWMLRAGHAARLGASVSLVARRAGAR